MESNSGIGKELNNILKESEVEKFLLMFQTYLSKTTNENQNPINKHYSLTFYRNLLSLNKELDKLNMLEKRLIKVKVNSLIAYLDDINKIILPSPLIIGVYTAVISLVLGVMIKDSIAFPEWAIVLVLVCFGLIIPGISWFTLQQSGKSAEQKEVLTTIKEIVN